MQAKRNVLMSEGSKSWQTVLHYSWLVNDFTILPERWVTLYYTVAFHYVWPLACINNGPPPTTSLHASLISSWTRHIRRCYDHAHKPTTANTLALPLSAWQPAYHDSLSKNVYLADFPYKWHLAKSILPCQLCNYCPFHSNRATTPVSNGMPMMPARNMHETAQYIVEHSCT